jgi:diguanylate cyclase (GGDEF)-like protein/PAS domain S-box-containing protein
MMYFSSREKVFSGYRAVVLWLSVLLFSWVSLMGSVWLELRAVEGVFNDRAGEIHRTLTQRISSLETVLTSMVGLYHSSDFLGIAEQTSFSQEMLKAYPFICGILHMTRIPDERREEFELEMREQGFVSFALMNDRQLSGLQVSSDNYYLPVSFIEPMDPRSANLLGYDLTQQPGTSAALQQSIKSGDIATFGPININSTGNTQYFVLKPVYLGRYPPKKVHERLDMFSGMAVLRINLERFIEGLVGADLQFEVSLLPAAGSEQVQEDGLLSHMSKSYIARLAVDLSTFKYRHEVEIYGTDFELMVTQRMRADVVDWWKVTAIWMLSLLILGLTIGVYRNNRIAQLKEDEANAAIAAEDERFSHVIDTAFDAVITADADCMILSWNQQAVEVFGYQEADVLGLHLLQLILTHRSLIEATEALEPMFKGSNDHPTGIRLEVEGRDKGSRKFPLDLAISCSRIGEMFTLSVFARDITERKQWDEKIRTLAYSDSLTKLPNRQAFKEQVTRAIKVAKRHQRVGAVLYLDLDEFKRINDTLGHDIGDMLLKNVTNRLEGQLRETDTVEVNFEEDVECRSIARLGGDEFTVLLEDIQKPEVAAVVAKRVQDAIARSYNLNGHEVYVTPSIGIAIFPRDGHDVEELLKNADTAMYHAKAVGKNNFQFYSEQMNVLATTRLKLEGKLRKALTCNEMELFYQPQIDLSTGEIVSAEALLRWDEPELGMVSPVEFIPIAEETGMIIDLGEWVLNEACRQNKEWQEAGYSPIRIAVNLSSMQFIQRDLSVKVAKALKNSRLNPKYLELEITESIIMRNVNETITTLNDFKEMGISISVDDFGTGYSSLSYLKRFPLDNLKIDRTFVKDIPDNEDDVTITSAIIALAQSLGLGVVAEGVETKSQLQFLEQHGCEMAQGYLFSKPLPAEQLVDLLSHQNGSGAMGITLSGNS